MLKKIIAVILAVGIASTAIAGSGGGSVSVFGLEIPEMLAKGINFFLLLFLLHKWVKKPLVNVLNAAAKNSKDTLESAEQALNDAEAKLAEYKANVSGLEQKMAEMQKNSMDAIGKEKEQMIADAKNTADALEKQAKLRIEQNVSQAKLDIREHLVAETIKLAEAQIAEKMDAKAQKALVEDYAKVLTETA